MCDQVVLGYGPFRDSVTTTELAKAPERLTSGVDPHNGPPWQVVAREGGSTTTAMHLLLLEADIDVLHPRLGRYPDSDPWLGYDEPGVEAQARLARERTAQGLDMRHDGFQLLLATARDRNAKSGKGKYLAVLAKNMGTGHAKLYLHDPQLGQWSSVPELHDSAAGTKPGRLGLNEAAARAIYKDWMGRLLDPPSYLGAPARQPLNTTRFGRKIQRNLGIALSDVVNSPHYGPDSTTFPAVAGPQRTVSPNWLTPCDQRANRAYSHGIEPMLQLYQEQIGGAGRPPWAALAYMLDRLRGHRSRHPAVHNEEWSPYGNDRVAFLEEALSSIPRRARKPREDNGLAKTMARGTRITSRAALRRPRT